MVPRSVHVVITQWPHSCLDAVMRRDGSAWGLRVEMQFNAIPVEGAMFFCRD